MPSLPAPLSDLPLALGLGRTAVGLVMLATPRRVPEVLGADPAAVRELTWVVRMLGAREVALGLGAAAAGRAGDRREARPWLWGGLLSDAVDAVAVAGAIGAGRLRGAPAVGLVALACSAVAVEAAELARR